MTNFRLKTKNKKSGYAVLELVFYIALFAILSIVVINSLVTLTKSLRETKVEREVSQGGVLMERISREIRAADSINTITSSSLKLNTTNESEVNKTIQFTLSSGSILLYEDDVLSGYLNSSNITITGLSFIEITTSHGKAIKVDLSLRSNNDKDARVETFYNTVILRGAYES